MDKNFEFSTFLGIFLALGLIFTAILLGEGSKISSFFDLPSALIVFGGTFFATCASFTIEDVLKAISTVNQTAFHTPKDRKQIAVICITLADHSKKEGILSLQKLDNIYGKMHEFFQKHLTLIIDGLSSAETERLMVQEILSIKERHKRSVEILRKAAEISPAMGLVGTLIGLVQMLGNLSDPSAIGPAMAIALLTTFYGAVLAFVILIPLATKLEKNSREEIELLKIYGDAVLAIANQEGPMRLEMKMNANLSPEERVKIYS